MEIVETYYTILDHFKMKRQELGIQLLSSVYQNEIEDPFLAIKLTPPLSQLLPLIEDKEPLIALLKRLLEKLTHQIQVEQTASRSLLLRHHLACSLAKEWVSGYDLTTDPPILEISDFFHPNTGPDLFPLVFFQKGDAYRDIRENLEALWDGQCGFFKGQAFYSMHKGSFPIPASADTWMAKFCKNKEQTLTVPSVALFKDSRVRLESYWRGFHLVRVFLDGCSFSVQGRMHGNAHLKEEGIEVTFTYPALCDEQDVWALLGFYIDRSTSFVVNGQRALSFSLGDIISFTLPYYEVLVQFEQIRGKARVKGQVMPYRRPAEENEANAGLDWAVLLWPVAIEDDSLFRMSIRICG